MSNPTTGKLAYKPYACSRCDHICQIQTNHWGECYSLGSFNACPICPPFARPTTWVCRENPPKGTDKAPDWIHVGILI